MSYNFTLYYSLTKTTFRTLQHCNSAASTSFHPSIVAQLASLTPGKVNEV